MSQQEKYIFITGDSFCSYRTDPENHWPAKLAQLLGKNLQGHGYPGQGWWMSRLDLISYAATDKFADTDLFVFCHTEIHRPLTSNTIWSYGFTDQHREFFLKYIHDPDVDQWAAKYWYQEINSMLAGKKVLHLFLNNYHPELQSILNGTKLTPDLTEISDWCDGRLKPMIHGFPNHFTPELNSKFAQLIADNIDKESIELKPHHYK